MEIQYSVTIHLEVMHEGFAELLSNIRRLKESMGVSATDKNDPIAVFEERVIKIYHGIFGPNYNTMDDIRELQGQLSFARDYIRELDAKYVGRMERAGA